VLELAVVCYLELAELANEFIAIRLFGAKLVVDADNASAVFSTVNLGQRSSYFVQVQHCVYILMRKIKI
jgi:hypothetical protein